MNYFLRNFPHPLDELATLCGDGLGDEQQLFQAVQHKWKLLVEKGSECRFGRWRQLAIGSEENANEQNYECSQSTDQRQSMNQREEAEREGKEKGDDDVEDEHRRLLLAGALDSLQVVATPTELGANAIAQTIVYRLCDLFEDDANWPNEKRKRTNVEDGRAQGKDIVQNISPSLNVPKAPELVTIGLDSLFSVLLELNRREPDLCARSLHSLLQLLQVLDAGTMATQPRAILARMHEQLRELRREGNAQVSVVANACMMSLAVASGQPEFLFASVLALLCESKRCVPFNQLANSTSPLPRNFHSLALSVHRRIVGTKSGQISRWISEPLEQRPMVCEFDVIYTGSALIEDRSAEEGIRRGCLASDGAYVYLLTVYGFFKLGTGLCETRAGEVMVCNESVRFSDGSALYVSNGSLYLRHRHSARLWVLDTETLREIGEILLPSALISQGLLFSDGRQFWVASLDDQWHLAFTPLDDSFGPLRGDNSPNDSEGGDRWTAAAKAARTTQLRLMDCEFCAFGELEDTHEQLLRSIPEKLRGVTADLQLGPGVAFLLSRSGKVFFAISSSDSDFGLCSKTPFCWNRLDVPESIVSMALDSNSKTLVLRSGAGNLWLVGEQRTKALGKSPKAQQNKEPSAPMIRRIKVPNKKKCVSLSVASVGGGSLAFVTEAGRVFLLGRHVLNSAQQSQMPLLQLSPNATAPQSVPGIDNIPLAQVALGKTHLVGIAKNGAVYATGLNNQNQCGRTSEGKPQNEQEKAPSSAADAIVSSNSQSVSSSTSSSCCQFCSPSQHLFVDDLAFLCVRCGQCSVRGVACPFSNYKRAVGTACACAKNGPSCCVRCGLCRECAQADKRSHATRGKHQPSPKAVRLQHQFTGGRGKAPLAREEEELGDSERARREKTAPMAQSAATAGTAATSAGTATRSAGVTATTRIFPPERVLLQPQPNIKVATVSVGNFHTVVLSADNQVYTFGANTHGQLGTGDTKPLAGVHKLTLPANIQIAQVVAGANHTVLRAIDGRLISFGSHKAGQLGRKRIATPASSPPGARALRQWFAEPGFVPGFGQAYGRIANWVSAQGDRTVVQVQRQLISRAELADGRITASGDLLMLLPSAGRAQQQQKNGTRGYFMVRRSNCGEIATGIGRTEMGRFRHRNWQTQQRESAELELAMCSFCFDLRHLSLLWAYDPVQMRVFALSDASEKCVHFDQNRLFRAKHRQMILRSTELMVPSLMEDECEFDQQGSTEISLVRFSDAQMALFLLSIVYSLCLAIHQMPNGTEQCAEDEVQFDGLGSENAEQNSDGVTRSANTVRNCRVVRRFQNFGGSWGYSAHCVEAIQFMTNCEITFCGVGLFGGRGEYTARLKLYRAIDKDEVGTEAQQQCVELLAETDEVLYECGTRETATLQLERPIAIRKDVWHLIWVQIQGPSSDCGTGGRETVHVEMCGGAEDSSEACCVEFRFRTSELSNNGTNIEVGQIPELYFLPMATDGDERCQKLVEGDGNVVARGHRPKNMGNAPFYGERVHLETDHNDHRLAESLCPLFRKFCLSGIHQLLLIVEWALDGAFRAGAEETDELINCDALWRQERAAFVAVLSIRLIRHFLCIPSAAKNAEEMVEFHRLLKGILCRKSHGQDRISAFVTAEAALTCTILAREFAPNSALVRMRIVKQLRRNNENGAKAKGKANDWWLFAVLCSMSRLDNDLLPIIGISSNENENGDKRRKRMNEAVERIWRFEENANFTAGQSDDESSPLSIFKFLCEIAFGEMTNETENENDSKNELMDRDDGGYDAISADENERTMRGPITPSGGALHPTPPLFDGISLRLPSVAQRLITSLAHRLISRALPQPKTIGEAAPLFQSPSRFRHISAHAQWEVGGNRHASAWDAVAFRVDGPGIALTGVGIFSGSAATGPEHFELELVKTQSINDIPSGQQNEWHSLERVTGQTDTFPTQIVHFAHAFPLRPGACYAVKVRFEGAGKTLFGEGGLLSIQIRDQIRLHFLPCDLSRNGTTVSRGQFPFFLLTVADTKEKFGGAAKAEKPQEEEEEKAVETKKSAEEELFLHLLRQIVRRMSQRMVRQTTATKATELLCPGERRMCATLLGLANVWVEARPWRAFDVVAALDEGVSILAHLNAAEVAQNGTTNANFVIASSGGHRHMNRMQSSSSSASPKPRSPSNAKLGPSSARCSPSPSSPSVSSSLFVPSSFCLPSAAITVESLHPYPPGQFTVHKFEVPNCDFLCVRFDSQCQTAQSTDIVWVYVSGGNGRKMVPVANYHGRNWPRGQLLIPGNCLWLIFESAPRQMENDDKAAEKNAFGFRCTVEPISARNSKGTSNLTLERLFVWCLSNSCRALFGSDSHCDQMDNKSLHELLTRHGLLLLRGMYFGGVNDGTTPSMAQITEQIEFGTDQQQAESEELAFLKEFAEGRHAELSAFLCHQSVVSVINSQLKIARQEDIRIGRPVEITFVARDQHRREVIPVGELEVTVTLSSGTMGGQAEEEAGGGEGTDWGGLKAEQMKMPFRAVPCGRSLYQCVSALPKFAVWSLEELRFSFVFTRPLRNQLKLRRGKSEMFSAVWTPQKMGRHLVECAVDGMPLSGQIFSLEVHEDQKASSEHSVTIESRHKSIGQSDAMRNANAKNGNEKIALFPVVSPFFALKVRVLPSLCAPQFGLIHRGSSLQFGELLRNEDGVWLRLTEETKRQIIGEGNSSKATETEAWVLQQNAHLGTELLQLCPSSSNGISVAPPPSLRQSSAKLCPSPATISILDSPKFRKAKRAIGPRLFEAFRWVFVASVWHSSENDNGCTAEELIKAAKILTDIGTRVPFRWDTAEGHGNAAQMPPALRSAANAWRKLSDKICDEILAQKPPSFEEAAFVTKDGTTHPTDPSTELLPCELCGGKSVTAPIGKHMRTEHEGCGEDAGNCGYNSAGHWTVGWSGKCGEGGEGAAVWYLFCAKCRDKKLRKLKKEQTEEGGEGMARRMKSNSQFLLELNGPAGAKSPEKQRQRVVLGVQIYPGASDTPDKMPTKTNDGRTMPKCHSSDPCGNAIGTVSSSFADSSDKTLSVDSFRSVPSGAVLALPSPSLPCSTLFHVLSFVSSPHQLSSLRVAFRSSLFRSVAFSFAFRLWGWLIKMATSDQSVSDVIWHFLSALPPSSPRFPLRPHPAQLCPLAGPLPIHRMVSLFHELLRSLAVLFHSSAEGSEPRFKCHRTSQMTALCFRAWTFQLTDHEQDLLPVIRSLLSVVSNALSTSSDTLLTTESVNSRAKESHDEQNLCQFKLDDLSSEAQLDASSRAQMVGCLVDGNCDTFWESGEEERGRTERRLRAANFGPGALLLALFIDNAKDEGFRVGRLSITSPGRREDEAARGDEAKHLLDTSLDKEFSGWVKCAIDGLKSVEICLRGDELGCRVRQLRILGFRHGPSAVPPAESAFPAAPPPKSVSQQMLFTSGAQSDAFALFQLLATQVLCDRIAPEGTEDNALRETVLDMVTARGQLMHPLQQFVGTHLANAIQREVQSLRIRRRRNFSYVNALLQLLMRMNSVAAQPTVHAYDHHLLMALSDLWLFASEAVQEKALKAFECLITAGDGGQREGKVPEGTEMGVLAERLLVTVVKVLQIQVKEQRAAAFGTNRGRQQLTKHTIGTLACDVPSQWAISDHPSAESARFVIRFLRSLRPSPWRAALRAQLAHLVLSLCSSFHDSLSKGNSLTHCVYRASFWLSVAALAAIGGIDWLEEVPAYQRLKSAATDRTPSPLCDNHDDGRTRAQLRCQTCALSLCRDCFSVLHLSRRNQCHRAQPIGVGILGVLTPRMDFHEGCNRLRLISTDQHHPLLLILINPNSLIGLVELGAGTGKISGRASGQMVPGGLLRSDETMEEEDECTSGDHKLADEKCRFCGATLATAEQRLNGLCELEECHQKDSLACQSVLSCGHLCHGIREEIQCPPCLLCSSDQFHQDADDLCSICFSERLGEAPCVQLKCAHFFHWQCVRTALEKRWPGPRISFRFMQCPLCKENIDHPAFADLLKPLKELESDVKRKARMRLEYECGGGWGALPGTSAESTRNESALLETALDKYVYVQCSRCLKAYFGGESRCQLGLEEVGRPGGTEFDPAELVCGGCAAEMGSVGAGVCGRHGTDFLEFKCRFCCSVAVYFCFGTTHFCAVCHGDFQRLVRLPRHALPKCPAAPRAVQLPDSEPCPLRIASHPPTGEEFALGCGICRNLRSF
ncbi:hypothetical protein niasHS_012148 [Heterodera schachtii]|uniref:RCR-type E3 ubiquitin transferase n=1 Tax=Heterodera schachtii TaxID=97005 RepID=A0ABD2IG56_HETSC